LKDFWDLEESQVMGEPAAVAVASSSATPAAVTEGNSDIYAGIPTLPISAALAAAGSETAELNGGTCGLLDRPNKKQVHCCYVFFGVSCLLPGNDGARFLFVSLKLSPLHQKCDSGNWLQVCLFYCSETEDLARRIAAETDSIELKSIKWGFVPFLYTNFSFLLLFCVEITLQN
jgi:hypothetical protein